MIVTGATLRRIAAMPEQAMAAALLFLAEQLEQLEGKRSGAAERQRRYRLRHSNGDNDATVTQQSHNGDVTVTALAPVLDNITSTSKQEVSKEKGNLTVSQKGLPSKPLPSEPKGFAEFWEIYPRRSGGNDRVPAMKGFAAAVRRAGGLDVILAGARRYRAHCDAKGTTGGDYVLKARKWLNAQSWNEAYENNQCRQKPGSIAAGFAIIDAALEREERAIREEEERQRTGEADADELPGLRQVN